MDGRQSAEGAWLLPQNVSEAMLLLENASLLGSLEAHVNLARIYLTGIFDYASMSFLVPKNVTRGLYHLSQAVEAEAPMGYHTLGEIVHYEAQVPDLPETFLELYNLTSK